MNVLDVLQRQFDLYEQYAVEAEGWQIAHREAMACWNVEDAIEFGLNLLRSLQRRHEQWAKEVEAGRRQYSLTDAREGAERFAWWLERSKPLLQAVEFFERESYRFDRANEFREAVLDVSLMSLDVDANQKSIASLQTNRGIPAKQAMDGLRDHLRRGVLDRVLSLDMPEVVDCVEKAMNRLADNPLLHGRRG